MSSPSSSKSVLSWLQLSFGLLSTLMVLAIWTVVFRVDLDPKVESDFFFSSEDPAFRASLEIAQRFPSKPQLIFTARGLDVTSPEYLERITSLTDALLADPAISSVQSLTRGPSSPAAVLQSPVWSRVLLTDSPDATQLVALVDESAGAELIARVEQILAEHSRPSFDLEISGVPYVVELIRRHLLRDLRLFSLAALSMFGLVISLLYRSMAPIAGTLLSCVGACLLTLTLLHLVGTPIGLLTANIATIVFVLTLSHTVFLTANWQRLRSERAPEAALAEAIRITFTASFWCMVAALSGFGSLLLASAKPLRELGISGVAGTAVAITVAYGFYPWFLRAAKAIPLRRPATRSPRALTHAVGPILVAIACLAAALGLPRIDTDPSVFAYFSKRGEIREGLERLDRSGGSSPLLIVVSEPDGRRLDARPVDSALGRLQQRLEDDPAVGVSLSLAVLLEEARRVPFATFLSSQQLVDILDSPRYDNIARSFVDEERRQGLFFLRMRETGRSEPRQAIIHRLTAQAEEVGLQVELVGGLYDLQGKLGELVASSLVRELGGLLVFFVLVAAAVSRSPRTTLAMVLCLAAVPVLLLGAMGHFSQPVDVISAPGANVAIALGIDAMIHLIMAVRRQRQTGAHLSVAWQQACAQMRRPIIGAMLILAAGFGIFLLSSFPPTQRFGTLVAAGTLISAVMALVVLPFLVLAGSERDRENP